jgi:hypothetical protein
LIDKYITTRNIGFHGHAFILSFYYLLRYGEDKFLSDRDFYFNAVRETIRLGGDTDTNGCIVGGMIGALVGVHNIPSHMIEKLLKFDCTSQGIRRP